MKNIQTISTAFKWLFKFVFIALLLYTVICWAFIGNHAITFLNFFSLGFDTTPHSLQILSPLTAEVRVLGFLVSLIPLAIQLTICYLLINLFKNFEKMRLFVVNNVSIIKRIGYFLLLGQLISPFYEAILTALLTMNNPTGHHMVAISFSTTNLSIIVIAFFMILIAGILQEGCKLQEEQQYTV